MFKKIKEWLIQKRYGIRDWFQIRKILRGYYDFDSNIHPYYLKNLWVWIDNIANFNDSNMTVSLIRNEKKYLDTCFMTGNQINLFSTKNERSGLWKVTIHGVDSKNGEIFGGVFKSLQMLMDKHPEIDTIIFDKNFKTHKKFMGQAISLNFPDWVYNKRLNKIGKKGVNNLCHLSKRRY